MRTYDDTFSGQKIYPGKVRFALDRRLHDLRRRPSFRTSQQAYTAMAEGLRGMQLTGEMLIMRIGQALRPR